MKVKIETRGLEELRRSIDKKTAEIDEAGREGLKRAGMQILATAKENLQKNNSIATGQVRNSGVVEGKENDIDVVFKSLHASAVEFGRRAGKQPPTDNIMEWIKKKGFADTTTAKGGRRKRGEDFYKRAKALAFLIARKIGKFGVKARPFLYPAFRQNEDEVMKILTNSIKKKL